MDEAIRTERLTKYYGGRKVVDHLDLRIPRGTVYGLLGRNGAGKSTTLKMLTGMVRPDYGRIELLGEDVATLAPATRARIAYLAEGHPIYAGMLAMYLATLDSIKEGDHTLLDRTMMLAYSETGFAKIHALENLPMFICGGCKERTKRLSPAPNCAANCRTLLPILGPPALWNGSTTSGRAPRPRCSCARAISRS